MTETTDKLNLDELRLAHGGHTDRSNGLCFNEAVAWFAGEEHSASPRCISRVINVFTMRLNDRWDDETRQLLVPYIARVVGTATTVEDELRRGYMLADWIVRDASPRWLDVGGLSEHATLLRNLDEIVDPATARAAAPVVREARDAAWKKRAESRERLRRAAIAAIDAIAAIAASAASAASAAIDAIAAIAAIDASAAIAAIDASAAIAAIDAIDASAASAAIDADRIPSYEEIRSFIRKRFAPTITETQEGALQLLDRLIAVGKTEVVSS